MSFNRMYLGEKTLRHERRKFRLSCLPIGALASAFVAVAVAGAEPGSAKIAAAPSSEEPVQLVPAEAQPANTPQVAPATSQEAASQEAASVEPQVAQSGEGEAKDAQEEPEAFPPETLTDRAGVETLGDVVRYAVLNHPAIKQSVAVKHGSEFAVDEEYAGYLPSVDLSAQAGWEHTDSPGTRAAGRKHGRGLWNSRSGLAVDQPLFTGFQTVERVAAARHTVVGNTRLISANAEDIAVGAVQSYLDVQRNREFVRIAEKNVQVHLDILDKVKKRAARIGVRSDVDQADGRVALANALLEERRQGLRDSESQFQNFVGLFPGNLSSDIDPRRIPELDLQTIINQSLAANPRVLAIRSEIRSNRAAARRRVRPMRRSFRAYRSGSTTVSARISAVPKVMSIRSGPWSFSATTSSKVVPIWPANDKRWSRSMPPFSRKRICCA